MQEIVLFASRLKQVVRQAGGAEWVSEQSGIPRRTLETYLAGKTEPKYSKIMALARVCNVDVHWLMTGEDTISTQDKSQLTSESEWVDLPLFDNTSAQNSVDRLTGAQKTAIEQMGIHHLLQNIRFLTHIKFRRPSLLKFGLEADKLLAVRVSGDAMLPMIKPEDSVLVDTRRDFLRADDMGIYRVGPQLLVRRLQYLADGTAALTADHAGHAAIQFASHEEAANAWVGKVVWIARWVLSNA